MNRLKLVLIIIILLGPLYGCIPTSVNPISVQDEFIFNEQLFGVWRSVEDKEQSYYHFGDQDKGLIQIIMVIHNGDSISHGIMKAHVSKLNESEYLNVRLCNKIDCAGHIFVKYRIVDDKTMEIALQESEYIETAITKGLIEGKDGDITAKSEDIAAFIIKHDADIFTEYHTLSKIN